MAFLYQYFKEWRKNPEWSFSCCLALLLPLNDLQGEIRGMAGKNILKTQLQTGIIEKPSIAACAKDSGAMSFTPNCEEGGREEENKMELQEQSHKVVKYSKTKCHLGTQTDAITRPVDAIGKDASVQSTQQKFT